MSTATLPAGKIEARQQFLIEGVTWQQYVAITDALPDRAGLRTAFDGTRLELMTTSYAHERYKRILNRLIEALTFELGYPLNGGGNTTFRKEELDRGLEPDECFWIENALVIENQRNWDPDVDPPPDLAVEIDVASSSVNREEIYARLGVPELWRFDGDQIQVFRLNEAGEYEPVRYSLSIRNLTVSELLPFLHSEERDENTLIRSFVKWVREQGFPRKSG